MIANMTSQYEDVHRIFNGPGDARPTAQQIVEDQQLKGKWPDKAIMITGCSSGIGIETAKALFETGASLYLTARDLQKARSALGTLTESDRVHLLELDLNSLASVRSCAQSFLAQSDRLHVLINNAGVMATPEGRTQEGFETQFGTNHLAHFLLVQLLLPTFLNSSTPEFQSRVIILASIGHRDGQVNFANLNFEGQYHSWMAYAQSKTANVWTANELDRRYGSQGLHAWSVHPGGIMTGLTQHLTEDQLSAMAANPALTKLLKSTEQGAATSVWAATAKALEGQGGKYLEDCQISKPWDPTSGQIGPGYAAHAYSEADEGHLWKRSVELVEPYMT